MESSLAKIRYSCATFKSTTSECAICLGEFSEGEKVSPLHCDIKHVFHTHCIKTWLIKNPVCPLCKAEISPTELKLFNKDIKRLLKELAAKDDLEDDKIDSEKQYLLKQTSDEKGEYLL